MFKLAVVAVLIACASAAVIDTAAQQFAQWKFDNNKVYATAEEEATRFAAFQSNLAFIEKHNAAAAAGKYTFTVGLNQFADLTLAEFKAQYLGVKFNRTTPRNDVFLPAPGSNDDVDWRTKGAVTPVKNQGACGSCWAFSSTGSIEGAWVVAGNSLVSLSEQELVDCSGSFGNQGCNGGLMDYAFQYVIKNGGIDSESDYTYKASTDACDHTKEGNKVAHITSFADVPQNNEAQLIAAIAKQPVSVAIEADHSSFQLYKSGVFNDPNCGQSLDHGVLAVGYTDTYFIVKNSWGVSWGDNGYIMMARGISQPQGICGIDMMSSYPIVGSPSN